MKEYMDERKGGTGKVFFTIIMIALAAALLWGTGVFRGKDAPKEERNCRLSRRMRNLRMCRMANSLCRKVNGER